MKHLIAFFLVSFFLFSKPGNLISQVVAKDSLALVDLYKSNNGESWGVNWLHGPVSSWNGVSSVNFESGNPTRVWYLDLRNFNISILPPSFKNLTGLDNLYLSHTKLSGKIPDVLFYLKKLYTLDLSFNNLSGNIPAEIGDFPKLEFIYLNNNKFSGNLPDSFKNYRVVRNFFVDNNMLTGGFPLWMNKLSFMYYLGMTNNQFSGKIPDSLFYLHTNLLRVGLSNNHFSGTVDFFSKADRHPAFASIDGNDFNFSDLEVTLTMPDNKKTKITYSPQANIKMHIKGSSLSVTAGGTLRNNTYKWYKDGALDTTIIGDSVYTPLSPGNYNVAVTNTVVTGLTLFSDTLKVNTTLPLSFLDFTGALKNGDIILNWQTASEQNVSYFNILRSIDRINFTAIKQVKATGSINIISNYNYVDADVRKITFQNLYYRLEEVDKDSRKQLSKILLINNNFLNNLLVIHPNPVRETLYFNLPTPAINSTYMQLYGASGKTVFRQKLSTSQSQKIDINKLPAGNYNLIILENNHIKYSKPFVIQP